LRELLSRWPNSPKVDLVTTDGFLHPNDVLEERGMLHRKGFPESYDVKRLLSFVADVKAGRRHIKSPVYSHHSYDIIPNDYVIVDRPDILIIEGLNVLQNRTSLHTSSQVFVSDYFDFSIYVDAHTEHLERWYIDRFLQLRDTAFLSPTSYFHRYIHLSATEAADFASHIWHTINAPNLRDNILPTRERANLILKKGADHSIHQVRLRKR